jgi:copper chaperone
MQIDGMRCGMCEAHMNDAVRNAFPVKKVSSSHSRGQTVILTEREIDEQSLKEIVEKTGYRLISVSKVPYEKKGFFSFLGK